MSFYVDVSLLRQEAADLHRFVGSIIRFCDNRRDDYPVFSETASEFFSYIHELGSATQRFLENFPADLYRTEESVIALSKRQKLRVLRDAWERLHEYVKPALDADSLNLPTSLIDSFESMVRNVEDWADFRFVYFHTTEANYLQVPPERVKDIADQIASEVDGNSLPETIGLVGIPYSQSNSFYLNCLLPHEFGHFIYSQAASFDVETEIDKSLDAFTTVQNIADEEVISYRRDTLRRWIEETFCDLVALWLIGPAFTFAYSELTGASLSLGRELSDSTELYEFNNSYPADAARFYVHLQALKRLGWWNKISETASAPILVLKHFEHWSNDLYINIVLDEGDSIPDTDFMNLYKSLVGWLIDYVDETVPSGPSAVSDFDKQFPIISSYLERAVVPSTIRVGDERVYPSASVLLNSGYSFKLTRLANLLNRIDKRHPDSVTDVSELSERVELWILKSLEDQRLLTGQNNGSSSHE